MGERTEQIEGGIQVERAELRANLDELRSRIRSATDWRRQFRSHPMLGLGLAFGGGILLAGLLRAAPRGSHPPHASTTRSSGRGQLLNAWETIQSALIGVAANKVSDVLVDLVPGFREHLAKRAHFAEAHRGGNGHGEYGEGNYAAARRYRAGVKRYMRNADVAAAARAAEPRNEAEAAELEAAEDEGRSHAKRS
jgi:hypothetical protein